MFNSLLNIEKRFKTLEHREKMIRYAYDSKTKRLPGLAKTAYINELGLEEKYTMEKYNLKAPEIFISLDSLEKK
jgi:hypothetical protein